MPTIYRCETCGQIGESLDGWQIVSVNFLHVDVTQPLSGRMLDSTAPDLVFDKYECLAAWCTQADVPAPPGGVHLPARETDG